MSSDNEDEPQYVIPPDTVEKLKRLQEAVEDTLDFTTASQLCLDILDLPDKLDISLRTALYEMYLKSLLHVEDYDTVVQAYRTNCCSSSQNKKSHDSSYQKSLACMEAYAYALYRTGQWAEARQIAPPTLVSLLAQCAYHLAEPRVALDYYQQLLSSAAKTEEDPTDVDPLQVNTNMAAVLLAHAIPYVRTEEYETEAQAWEQYVSFSDKNDFYSYDLAYNLATWHCLTTSDRQQRLPWQSVLRRAAHAAEQSFTQDDDANTTEDHRQKEVAPILHNLEWSRSLWSGTPMMDGPAPSTEQRIMDVQQNIQWVQLHNKVLSMNPTEGYKLLVSSTNDMSNTKKASTPANVSLNNNNKTTPLQHRIALYNRSVLALTAGQYDACLEACSALLSAIQGGSSASNSNAEKKGTNTAAPHSTSSLSVDEFLWWRSREAVVRSQCMLMQQRSKSKTNTTTAAAPTLLKPLMDQLHSRPPSPVRDHALAYLQLHQWALVQQSQDNGAMDASSWIRLLQDLPASWQHRRAVVASLALMHHQQQQTSPALDPPGEQVQSLLRETGNEHALADFAMSQGDYATAARLYEAASSKDPAIGARWVQALSYIDPVRARAEWSRIQLSNVNDKDDDEEEDNLDVLGAQLESRELPRVRGTTKSRKALNTSALTADPHSKKHKPPKSQESILRHRAKKREQHLARLAEKGQYDPDRPPKVDPERWLPKFERSYSRRRRNRGAHHKGSQGGVSEKDAAKLDVVARQAARASGEVDDAAARSTAHLSVSGGPRRSVRKR
jgi:tetratricopeptide (TPR) repeat protein